MADLIAPNQVGVREDLDDVIAVADMKDCPVTSMIKKGKEPGNMLMSWQLDAELDVDTSGTLDGEDVTVFKNHAENRELVSVYAQKFQAGYKIGDLAQNVSNVAGLSAGEKANAVAKAIIQQKRNLESKVCSDDDTTAQSGATPYGLRGLGSFINNSAQALLPIPAQYRTPTASIDSTASVAAMTEADLTDVLQSIYDQTGRLGDFDAPCGSLRKKAISDLQLVDLNVSAGTSYVAARTVNKDQSSNVMQKRIDIYKGDFGTVRFHLTDFLGWSSGSRDTTAGRGRMYILDMKDLTLRYRRNSAIKDLQDNGGGPRFQISTICGLIVGNPLRHGAFKSTAV